MKDYRCHFKVYLKIWIITIYALSAYIWFFCQMITLNAVCIRKATVVPSQHLSHKSVKHIQKAKHNRYSTYKHTQQKTQSKSVKKYILTSRHKTKRWCEYLSKGDCAFCAWPFFPASPLKFIVLTKVTVTLVRTIYAVWKAITYVITWYALVTCIVRSEVTRETTVTESWTEEHDKSQNKLPSDNLSNPYRRYNY